MPADPLFPTRTGGALTRDALARRLAKYATIAADTCPSLASKTITPHALRHYVDGMVMWPAGVFPLLTASGPPIPAT